MQSDGYMIINLLAWKNWKDSSEARHSSKFLWESMGLVAGPPTFPETEVTSAQTTPIPGQDQILEDHPLQD